MKNTFVLVLLFLGMSSLRGSGQEAGNENPRQAEPSQESLIQEAERGNKEAILELGNKGKQEVIPKLKKIGEDNKNRAFGSVSSCTQMALAKLGDNEAMSEILAELKSDDPMSQDHAIRKLAYVASDKAIEVLVNLLENDKPRKMKGYDPNMRGPKGEMPQGKIIYEPVSAIAMKSLAKLIPNPIIPPGKEPTSEDIRQWIKWWKQNKPR